MRLSLEQDAPTQHTDPERLPPDEHSHVTQHPPFAHPPFDTSNRLAVGFTHASQ